MSGDGAETLGFLDASFLFIEEPGLLMQVAGLAVYDSSARPQGPIRPAELRARMRERLDRLPRFRKRLSAPGIGLRWPRWVPDDRFDLAHHLGHRRLPATAGWHDLLALAAAVHARPLPRDRPLWHATLIDGLPGGRQAVLTRTHHALTDGIASVEVADAMFDEPASPPDRESAERAPRLFGPPPGRLTGALQAALGAGRYLAGGPIASPGPFNGRVGPGRALATADLTLQEAREIKRRLGGSVDDVVLATVALALGRYLRRAGTPTAQARLRAMVPVSTRGADSAPGNRVTATFIDLPVGLPPVACLHEIAASKSLHRTWHEPLGLRAAVDAGGLLPAPLASLTARTLAGLPFANLIVSDVPGAVHPPRLLGAPMVAAYPLMPLARSVGLSIAVVTTAGEMGVGITVDPAMVPDCERMAADVGEAFAELGRAARASVRPPRRPPPAPAPAPALAGVSIDNHR